ncbi:histidine kinase [Paenibacillus sp. J5C_2022]|uniref:sensor histidine kinase n=1 Tax=Paenibacillus sp. J5C2022 TaxID=2977129 RepID=UPI0021D06E9A|nr:sensor histidine kinase [Paenibacillus sp. J5C2022]MCU6711249.1 histidine kinase [Paenibacillus sp. J5C2022]
MKRDLENFSVQIMKQANLHISRYFQDSEHFFETLLVSDDLKYWAQANSYYRKMDQFVNMQESYIIPYVTYHHEALTVMLYSEHGEQFVYRSDAVRHLHLQTRYQLSEQLEKWDNGRTGIQRMVFLSEDYRDERSHPITTPILRYVTVQHIGQERIVAAMDLSLQYIQDLLNEIQLSPGSYAMIVNDSHIVTAPDMGLMHTEIKKSWHPIREQDDGYFYDQSGDEWVIFLPIPSLDWKVVVTVPNNELTRSIAKVRNWTILMTTCGLLVAVILIGIAASSITKRLKQLRHTIKRTITGNLNSPVDIHGTDEVAEIAAAYNHLLSRMDEVVSELTDTRVVQQRAVMSAMQVQIHSHFYYNALEAINSMAHLAGHQEIRQTAVSLSNLLRYTSNFQDTVVTIREEMRYLQHYLAIMKRVYQDAMSYCIAIDPAIEQAQCMKVLLQPLAENSFKHGYTCSEEGIHIEIRGWMKESEYGKQVYIRISDNGLGFSDVSLEKIREQLSAPVRGEDFTKLNKNVGLLNVLFRLKSFYGSDQTRLEAGRSEQGGAQFTISFPFIPQGGS